MREKKEFNELEQEYNKKRSSQNIPIITDVSHLCSLLGYQEGFIFSLTNNQSKFYRTFEIGKKSGGQRKIEEPFPVLKRIQYWINNSILQKVRSQNTLIKSYRKGVSIRDNARFHKNQKKLLTLDIKDYFGSIKEKDVYFFFKRLGYKKDIAMILTKLCTKDKKIPQGAPTSPLLSNLITNMIDIRIFNFCKKHKIRYTRYADDMSFSGDFDSDYIIKFVVGVLKDYNFKLNFNKIRNRKQGQCQEVTGIVVNEKLQAPKKIRKKLRQEIYYIKTLGLEKHLENIGINIETQDKYIDRLIGKLNFVLFINKKDSQIREYLNVLYAIKRGGYVCSFC